MRARFEALFMGILTAASNLGYEQHDFDRNSLVGIGQKWDVGKCQKTVVGKCPRKLPLLENVRIFFCWKMT